VLTRDPRQVEDSLERLTPRACRPAFSVGSEVEVEVASEVLLHHFQTAIASPSTAAKWKDRREKWTETDGNRAVLQEPYN
jgi:hypothetical protein